jgi:3-phosphoshikimate 1-carboxyvinyltransferase
MAQDIRLSSGFSLKRDVGIAVTGSKSETNRLLLLQALFPAISLENTSGSDDSAVMAEALRSASGVIDVQHAGTAMRFLTAYFAASEGREVVLTGSPRMQERPIGILVDALNALGASVSYEGRTGFPPLRIRGKALRGGHVKLKADVSSQYSSALLLVAPKLRDGLTLELEGAVTSAPYIRMTLALLGRLGIPSDFSGRLIRVPSAGRVGAVTLTVESDWSSASYFYSIVALADAGMSVTLSSFRADSLQGWRGCMNTLGWKRLSWRAGGYGSPGRRGSCCRGRSLSTCRKRRILRRRSR